MLAPIDKVRSGVNDIMQIVVTTACTLNCSNCTQLLPFRKDYLHMDLGVFREALESLEGWPGVVALFGGNPCSHPQFHELCTILAEYVPEQERRGLWSNDLLGHQAIAYWTFYPNGRFNLNAHGSLPAAARIWEGLPGKLIPKSAEVHSMHAPILVDYLDMGVKPEDWPAKREACDINQKWSGAIVEREGKAYGYFCEVAASLDGVRGLNSGVPATEGWWRKGMESAGFSAQVKQCCDMGCGVPLKLKPNQDSEDNYRVSHTWELIEKKRRVMITPIDATYGQTHEVTDYMAVRGGKK